MKGAKGHHHGKRASGGRTDMWVSGNPDVKKEAEGKESYDKGDERKHGGKREPYALSGHPQSELKIGGEVGEERHGFGGIDGVLTKEFPKS